ncbi:hypothetical protein [Streptosporangium roseum]|uniref:Uncharacterized protein n=1 Tax=Streptosporangium roseum (strain ATCC 12428 / DSM 43021 / JCM 3005 / KCTC 9067 / NCIMB 10171 / NRRL 2505 / NI 9100) TaxID=479432 RepID=D2BFW6_STRRD|nr:hypothetical protein [Streptosporangium roseum]ACZ92018.1 hypothetical protein Sros_9400 [Streptosporangium roseum DSM 43021]
MSTTTPYRSRYPQLAAMAGDRPLADVELTIGFERPTYHGHTELTVRPGVIDEAAIELYGYSQCHILARSMHRRTRWSFGVVELVDSRRWAHLGVLTPAGHFLDIEGVRPVDQVVAEFLLRHSLRVRIRPIYTLDDVFTVIGGREEMRQIWIDGSDIDPLSAEVADIFADLLLAQADAVEAVSV